MTKRAKTILPKATVGKPQKASHIDGTISPLAAVHELARDMFEIGGIDQKTMREYDALCLPTVPSFDRVAVVEIRRKANVSQNLFAHYLNTSPSTVQKWESGQKKPSGMAAKLLQIIDKHGIAVLA